MNVGLNELKIKLENYSLKIAVIGLGRIGLPTAVAVSRSGLLTKGVDINPSIVESVNAGKLRVDDEPGLQDELSKVIQSKKLSATTEISEAVNDADVIIVCLPTPLDNKTKTTNYSYLLDGSMNIKIRKNCRWICPFWATNNTKIYSSFHTTLFFNNRNNFIFNNAWSYSTFNYD